MTTLSCGETTEVPEQRPKPIPAPSEMKIAPLTRYCGSVGSSIVSEVAVSTGSSAEPWAGGVPSTGRAARIRSGVQKPRAWAGCSAKEIDGTPACAAPSAAGPAAAATAGANAALSANAPERMG